MHKIKKSNFAHKQQSHIIINTNTEIKVQVNKYRSTDWNTKIKFTQPLAQKQLITMWSRQNFAGPPKSQKSTHKYVWELHILGFLLLISLYVWKLDTFGILISLYYIESLIFSFLQRVNLYILAARCQNRLKTTQNWLWFSAKTRLLAANKAPFQLRWCSVSPGNVIVFRKFGDYYKITRCHQRTHWILMAPSGDVAMCTVIWKLVICEK